MLGPPKVRDLDRPVLVSLESAVPKDHSPGTCIASSISPLSAISPPIVTLEGSG